MHKIVVLLRHINSFSKGTGKASNQMQSLYLSILNECASAGALAWVKDVHSYVVEAGLESRICVWSSALVHMDAKSGMPD